MTEKQFSGSCAKLSTRRRRAQHSVLQSVALKLGVVLVMFGFQMNLVAVDIPLVYALFYSALMGCFLVTFGERIRPLTLLILVAMMLVATLFGNPLKGLGLGVGAWLGYIAVAEYETDYRKVMIWLLVVNTIIVVIQFLGVWEVSYQFINYGNYGLPIPVTDEKFGASFFLPQFRPSGIFPSTTYVSAYAVLLYSTVVASPSHKGRVTSLCTGMFFALLGSTVGLFLALCSVPLMFGQRALRYLVGGYVISMVLYATYIPLQFAYNFNADEVLLGFASRLDLSAVSGESVLQGDALIIFVLCFAGLVLLGLVARFGSLALLVPLGCGFAMPILVHDITLSIFYWFLMGAVTSRVLSDGRLRRLAKSFKQRQKPSGVSGGRSSNAVLGDNNRLR